MSPERNIRDAIKRYLEARDWKVYVTHGNAFQVGFPDLYLAHKQYGKRWVDVKVEGRYSFTAAQRKLWPEWEEYGIGIWILTAATEEQYRRLFDKPNWRDYWKDSYNRIDINKLLDELEP